MLKNYIQTTFRSFKKNKGYTSLNILGLAVGFASVLYIAMYISHETSYDSFLPNAQKIFRLSDREYALTSAAHLDHLAENLEQIESKTLVLNSGKMAVGIGDDKIIERNFLYATSDFFNVFEYDLDQGSFTEFERMSNGVVLTQSTALRLFKGEEAIGKELTIYSASEPSPYKVIAVIKDLPSNTHMKFNILATLPQGMYNYNRDSWGNTIYHGFFKTDENYSTSEIQRQSDLVFANRALLNNWFPNLNSAEEILTKSKFNTQLVLNITEIHNESNLLFEFEAGGKKNYLFVFAGTAVFILILAAINFINLSTVQSMKRAKEVGVRKALGSTQGKLISQFLLETTLLCVLAAALAVGMLEAIFALGKSALQIPFEFNLFTQPLLFFGLMCVSLLTGLLGGAYPAFYLSAFKPSRVLKGQLIQRESSMTFRNVLVVVQFTISISLAIYMFFIQGQLTYSLQKDLGFNRNNIITIDNSSNQLGYNVRSFKRALLADNSVVNAGYNQYDLFAMSTTFVRPENAEEDFEQFRFYYQWSDETYLETLDVEFVEGRNFSTEIGSDSSGIIINQSTARLLGFEEPIGKRVEFGGASRIFHVIGVVEDFNHQSFDKSVPPTGFVYWENTHDQLTVRLSSDIEGSLERVESIWAEHSDIPLDYDFMDAEFGKLFRREQQLGRVVGSFTFLAFFVACLGILGLAGHTAEQKTKEIGIRKVLGATVEQIVLMFSKHFAWLVLISTLIASPLAYFVTNYWLSSFAYKIHISAKPFVISGILGLLIVLTTISYHLIKAATANPAVALKNE